ncbi:Retrovirus-related Pol polyprotein from transposon TNT 1-94 [Cucumis melo var. makuwa]|uniref:Retrovirus-related Pol polyprotein from transposon TNT 1-94 n=1 Tax=Cucumis melo var. makuwa TaxID=1194695 RepID=A0A5D3BLE3_CUCMM|nr:Retrovirus-related Pol polyprotein from transposon TNT 1-94 [Cucumis melo var. makuwa]TYJ99947.1 Retrovirus-related Pol polyprotein from transposon TNT 1-94 [Cucumis melo var. makuwa]
MDLMGPMQVKSLGRKRHAFDEGIFYEFSALLTPQQNGVVERKNRKLLEMARVTCCMPSLFPYTFGLRVAYEVSSLINELINADSANPPGIDSEDNNKDIDSTALSDVQLIVPSAHVKKNYPSKSIIGEISSGITTRYRRIWVVVFLCYYFDTLVGYCNAIWAGSPEDIKTEAKYIAAVNSYTQLLWIKQMLFEYGINQESLVLYYYNMCAINISKNPMQHIQTKHIDIRHHFIRELVETEVITLEHVHSSVQLADILIWELLGLCFRYCF